MTMSEKPKGSAYSEKLQELLNKNKQIIKELEAGQLTTQQAAERVERITAEIKKLDSGGAGNG